MVSRFQRAVSLYTLLYYAEILASFYIIFLVAMPFYPIPLAWLIVAGLTMISYFSLKAARGVLTILALPAALYVLGPLGILAWMALAACSNPPALLSTSLALLAVTPFHDLGFSVALARYAFGPKALAAFLATQLLTMMSASALAGSYTPLSNSMYLGVTPLKRLDTAALSAAFGGRIIRWLELNWMAAGAYFIDPRTYAFIAMSTAAVAAARAIHVRVFQALERRREFAVYAGLPARVICPVCAWLAILILTLTLGWVYGFMGGGWGISDLALLPALPIAIAYSLALGSPVARYRVEPAQPVAAAAVEGTEQKTQVEERRLPRLDDIYDLEQVKARDPRDPREYEER